MAILNTRISRRPEDHALVIHTAEIGDMGNYTCRANNGWGEPVQANAKLEILRKMEVLEVPKPARFVAGIDYTFDCLVKVNKTKKETFQYSASIRDSK